MAKKNRKKKKNTTQVQQTVRLSQVLIVKNEEKNIETALTWAKNIAFEQIVVDTGSTDRTAEIAEELGAKVVYFEWINDFAAAKNFAMDLAKGNWIAILDADEYMSEQDASKLMYVLNKIQKSKEQLQKIDAIECPLYNLDDSGNVSSVIRHQRIFQNRPDLRFVGRIHEIIELKNSYAEVPEIAIIHTGYMPSTYKNEGKALRNVTMLRAELEHDPDNISMKYYLADSLKSMGTDEALQEAEAVFLDVLPAKLEANAHIKQLAYNFLIPRYSGIDDDDKKDKALSLCNDAVQELPHHIDYRYYRAVINNQRKNYEKAWKDLFYCDDVLTNAQSAQVTQVLMPTPILLYYQLVVTATGLAKEQEITKYTTIIQNILSETKMQSTAVGPYIRALAWDGASVDEILDNISNIYNIKNPADLMFLARVAKEAGAIEFTRGIMGKIEKVLGKR